MNLLRSKYLTTISTPTYLQGAFPHPFFLMEQTDEGLKLESYFVLIVTPEIFKIFYLAIARNTGVMKKIKIGAGEMVLGSDCILFLQRTRVRFPGRSVCYALCLS